MNKGTAISVRLYTADPQSNHRYPTLCFLHSADLFRLFPEFGMGYPQLYSQIPSVRFVDKFPLSPSIFHQRVTTFDHEQIHLRNPDHQKWIFVTNNTQLILELTTVSHLRNWCCGWLHQCNGRVWMHGVRIHFLWQYSPNTRPKSNSR